MNGQRVRITAIDYFIVTMLIFVSGHPLFCNAPASAIYESLFLVFSFLNGRMKFHPYVGRYLLCFVVIFVLQKFVLKEITFFGDLNLLMKIFFGSTVMWMLGERFRYAYLDIIAAISAISIVCFFLQYLNVFIPLKFFNFGSPNFFTAVIYNYKQEVGLLRNSGTFWEPGAFACYLMLVPMLFMDDWKSLVTRNPLKCACVMLALITTFSTTGYIAFFICLLLGLLTQSRRKAIILFIVVPVLLFAAYYTYNHLNFLGDKVDDQSSSLEITEHPEYNSTRMGSLLFDLYYIRKHPLIGNGMLTETRFADNPELWDVPIGHGNGFSNFQAQHGIPIFLLYIVLVYLFLPFSKSQRLSFIFVLILILQGEQLFNFPIVLSLPFLVINNRIIDERKTRREEKIRRRKFGYRYRTILK